MNRKEESVQDEDSVPTVAMMTDLATPISINGKTNCGLGRPLFMEKA